MPGTELYMEECFVLGLIGLSASRRGSKNTKNGNKSELSKETKIQLFSKQYI
jgi:hypothetical protein